LVLADAGSAAMAMRPMSMSAIAGGAARFLPRTRRLADLCMKDSFVQPEWDG